MWAFGSNTGGSWDTKSGPLGATKCGPFNPLSVGRVVHLVGAVWSIKCGPFWYIKDSDRVNYR